MKKAEKHLVRKFLEGSMSKKEATELKEWLTISGKRKKLRDYIQLNHLINSSMLDFDTTKAYNQNKLKRKFNNHKRKKLSLRIMKYAAILIILLGFGYLIYKNVDFNSEQLIIPNESIVLEFEDGIQHEILPVNQVIKNVNGSIVSVKQGDTLLYDSVNIETAPIYQTLIVPRGKTHKIRLADGSFVHLNAGSKLRFPTYFKGEARIVSLTGEAYFEIAKNDKIPFIVNTESIDITVLGTKFNISAYASDLKIETVLLEGSVALSGDKLQEKLLKPGQLGAWDIQKNNLNIKEVASHNYIAWTKGELLFYKKSFQEILRTLERKYNVEIVNKYPELNTGRYRASFHEESIEEVMETFTESRLFDYHISNNKIIIEKPKAQ